MLKQIKTIPSCRVKSTQTHATRPQLLLGMYDGSIQIYNTDTLDSRIYQVSDKTVRTAIFYEPFDYIIVGDDTGSITVLNTTLHIVAKIKAHKDFIRRVKCDSDLYSCSDDGLIKSWSLKTFKNLFIFKGHQHFVMDFILDDYLYSVGLDGAVKIWDRRGNCKRTIVAHENGINCIAKFGNGYMTGSDDFSIKMWGSSGLMNSTKVHNHNINMIRVFDKSIISCSEDGTAKVFDENLRMIQEIRHGCRIWDVAAKDNTFFIGTDDGLIIFKRGFKFLKAMSADKIFYYTNGTLFYNRIEKVDTSSIGRSALGAQKEIKIEESIKEITVSPSGRMIGLNVDSGYKIYSVLGFRQRTAGKGRIKMIDDNLYLKIGDNIELYSRNELKEEFGAGEDAFYFDQVYVRNENKIVGMKTKIVFVVNDRFVSLFKGGEIFYLVFDDKIEVRNINGLIGELFVTVSDAFIFDATFYYVQQNNLKYVLVGDKRVIPYLACVFDGNFIGIHQYVSYSFKDDVLTRQIDKGFIDFQKSAILGVCKPYSNNSKAIGFLMGIGDYSRALELVDTPDLKFEILLNLDRLDECKTLANNKAKNIKLAKKLISRNRYKEAALCYKDANDFYSAFILDSDIDLGEDLQGNLGLLKYMHDKKYEKVGKVLEKSAFYGLYKKNYLS